MRNKEEYVLRFDPALSNNKKLVRIFSEKASKVLWCSIKAGHVTDQYFNGDILRVAANLPKYPPPDWDEFKRITRPLSFKFGVITIRHEHDIDTEFWADIYNAIYGGRPCNVVLQTVTDTVKP